MTAVTAERRSTTGGFAASVAEINEIRTRDPQRIGELLAAPSPPAAVRRRTAS